MTRALMVAALLFGAAASAPYAKQAASAPPPAEPGFRLGVGPPVAASGGGVAKKSTVMAIRTEGCADAKTASITGTAEGLVGSERRSLPLILTAAGTPGVYGVEGNWQREGVWVLSFKGTCGRSQAGAVVPVRNGSFAREGAVFLTHPPAPGDVDAPLRTLAATSTTR